MGPAIAEPALLAFILAQPDYPEQQHAYKQTPFYCYLRHDEHRSLCGQCPNSAADQRRRLAR
jgi:hypothetical protein